MNECYVFINKNPDMHSAQDNASRQKKITELLQKGIFKLVISKNILSNT